MRTPLEFFKEICAIPHPSFREQAIAAYLVRFAEARGLSYYADAIGNVVIRKPASAGREALAPVMLQAHTDMVCEKTPGSAFCFETDPLELYEENGFLRARNTTLGADDGYGVAYMLAVLDDDTLRHPPLECFFSVQEEVGVGGPRAMDYSQLTATRIINLDAVEEGTCNMLQASVIGGEWRLPVQYEEERTELPAYRVTLDGFTAGHASVDHPYGRGIATEWMLRILAAAERAGSFRLADISCGTFRNNLAGTAEAVILSGAGEPALREIVETAFRDARFEHAETDPDIVFSVCPAERPEAVLTPGSARTLLDFLAALPNGIASLMHCDRKVQKTSHNLGTVRLARNGLEGECTAGYLFRAAYHTEIDELFRKGLVIGKAFGAVYETDYRYSGYYLNTDWELFRTWNGVYRDATGRDLYLKFTGGGNDVGTIMDGMGRDRCQAIGISPDITGVHTPKEALDLASFDRTYGYLLEVLKRLK